MTDQQKDFLWIATLDETEVIKSLRNIDRGIARMEGRSKKAFDSADKSSQRFSKTLSGPVKVAILGVATTVSIVGALITREFKKITEESLRAAKNLEILQASTRGVLTVEGVPETQILQGTEQAVERIRELSRDMGIDLRETFRAFSPFVDSLAEFEQIARITTALARAQPEQGPVGARISIQEALSGEFRSLRQRFEFTTQQATRLEDALDTGGVKAFADAFEIELTRMGRSFELFEGTAEQELGKLQENFLFIQEIFGTPILEAATEELTQLNEFLRENDAQIKIIAETFGEFVGQLVTFTGDKFEDFLQFIVDNRDVVLEFVADLQGALALIDATLDVIGVGGEENIDGATSALDDFISRFFSLNEILRTSIQLLGIFVAGVKAEAAFIAAIVEGRVNEVDDPLGFAIGRAREAGLEGIRPFQQIIETANESNREFRQGIEDRIKTHEAAADATTEEADAILALNQAMRDEEDAAAGLSGAQNKLLEERQKINEKIVEEEIRLSERLEDTQLKRDRAILDLEEEIARKRVDAARKAADRLEDIERKNLQDLADARKDIQRDEIDRVRDFNQETVELEQDLQKERIKAEEKFRDQLADLRARFDFQAEEAIRNNDAVALLRIRRQMEFELSQAKDTRDGELDALNQSGDERRQTLRDNFAKEIEEAKLQNERLLEDLRINSQRRLDEAEISRQRELEQIAVFEERKRQDIDRSFNREIADLERQSQRRIEALTRGLSAEIRAVESAAKSLEVAARRLEEVRSRIAGAGGTGRSGRGTTARVGSPSDLGRPNDPTNLVPNLPGGDRGTPTNPNVGTPGDPNIALPLDSGNKKAPARRLGGPTIAGMPFIVNEDGPELAVFSRNARIFSNTQMRRSSFFSPNNSPGDNLGSTVFDNSVSANVSMLDPSRFSPVQIREIENIISRVFVDARRRSL